MYLEYRMLLQQKRIAEEVLQQIKLAELIVNVGFN
jgi:hypothetical protein